MSLGYVLTVLAGYLLANAVFIEATTFNTLHHLGGNSPWFAGPNVFGIPNTVPDGCSADMAAFVSRHGSRYPDTGAYDQWKTLAAKIHGQRFKASGKLAFLETWEPVVKNPSQQLTEISIGGYKELYNMGVDYRWRYPSFYTDNTNYLVFANQYPASDRVIDSARLFTRGYMGPNSSFGDVYVLPSSDKRAVANSLAPSDLCSTYDDDSGGENATIWGQTYLPPITKRLNALISGNLTFEDSDVSLFPYLCGFETQITGSTSPWCDVFTEKEIKEYEYAQDIRYYYGSGPGSLGKNSTMMLPVLNAIIQRLTDGPDRTYTNSDNATWTPPPLIAMFTNDGQINQLASVVGVFDDQEPLPPTRIPENQIYIAANYVSMRGTINFERLSCGANETYVRIQLNDAVYPIPSCKSGPGKSCPLSQYAEIIKQKTEAAGDFATVCDITGVSVGTEKATFLVDNALPWEYIVKP